MRVVVTGASGNIGTAVLRWFVDHPAVESVVGVARHPPTVDARREHAKTRWQRTDLADPGAPEQLARIFTGADAVVHLAWRIAGRDRDEQERTNRQGSRAVLEAVRRAGVGQLTFLSSAAVYSPASGEQARGEQVCEDWPRRGIPGSAYSADKVAVEDMLDRAQADAAGLSIARIRPPSVLQTAAAHEIAALALGRLAPLAQLLRGRLPLLPLPPGVHVQFVAAADVADLVGRVVLGNARGAYNVAADPVLAVAELARLLGGRHVPAPALLARLLLNVTFRLHLQRLDPSWVDLLLEIPLLDCTKARAELGWRCNHDARALLSSVREAVARA